MSARTWDRIKQDQLRPPSMILKDDLITMVLEADADHDRSQQVDLGPSEIGNPCTYHLAVSILKLDHDTSDPWCRIIGTATHAWLEDAAVASNVRHNRATWTAERKVYPDGELLPSGGSADLYHADLRSVVDHKIVGAARQRKYRSSGPGEQYRRQAHLYGLGYTLAGVPVDQVAIAFWLRGGRVSDLYVWMEPYSEEVARQTLLRYRALRDLCRQLGPAVLESLPKNPDECFDCSLLSGETRTPDVPAFLQPKGTTK